MKKEIRTEVPDYSQVERKEVPQDFKWMVDDVYPNPEAWQEDKTRLLEMMDKIEEKKKKLDILSGKDV